MNVTEWRKSIRSQGASNCLEAGNFRKSRWSNPSGECVEVGSTTAFVAVRDTKNRDGVTLAIPASAWSSFLKTL